MVVTGPLLSLLLAAACGAPEPAPTAGPPPPPVSVRSAVDRPVAHIEEPIVWTLEAEYADGYEVVFPSEIPELAGLRVSAPTVTQEAVGGGRTRAQMAVTLEAAAPGTWALPPLAPSARPVGAEAWTPYPTSDILLEVVSVLPPDAAELQKRDLKPLEPKPPAVPTGALVAAAVATAVLLAGALVWRWARRPPPPDAPPDPADVARRTLDRLAFEDRSTPALRRAWVFTVAEVLARYLEAALRINATDLTSEELLALARHHDGFTPEACAALERFASAADRARYAGDPTDPTDADAAIDAAREAVAQVEAARAAAAAAAAAAARAPASPTETADPDRGAS